MCKTFFTIRPTHTITITSFNHINENKFKNQSYNAYHITCVEQNNKRQTIKHNCKDNNNNNSFHARSYKI